MPALVRPRSKDAEHALTWASWSRWNRRLWKGHEQDLYGLYEFQLVFSLISRRLTCREQVSASQNQREHKRHDLFYVLYI